MVILLREYKARLDNGEELTLYAERLLLATDLRAVNTIRETGNVGVGSDGVAWHDGQACTLKAASAENEHGTEAVEPRA